MKSYNRRKITVQDFSVKCPKCNSSNVFRVECLVSAKQTIEKYECASCDNVFSVTRRKS